MPSPAPLSSSPPRWWPNFRLRTLLILLGIVAIGLAYVANLRQRVLHQRRIVAIIGQAGSTVGYDYEYGLGDTLDYEITLDLDQHTDRRELKDGSIERTITTSQGEQFIHINRPPGPKFLRQFLGDDVFARVESVEPSWSLADPYRTKTYDPRILLELPDLKVLLLSGSIINDESLRIVAQIPQLRVLSLADVKPGSVTRQGLEELAAAKNLESLALNGDWTTNEVVTGIRPLRNLKSLFVSSAPHLSSGVFTNVAEMPELCDLQIYRAPQLSDEGAENLARLRKLRVFIAVQSELTDVTLSHLAKLPNMELLDVANSDVSDAGMQHVAELSSLRILNVSLTNVSDAGLRELARLPRLTNLRLANTAITDAGAQTLTSMALLDNLDVNDTEIGDEGALLIGSSREFERLTFGNRVSQRTATQIQRGWRAPSNLIHFSKPEQDDQSSASVDAADNDDD